MINATKNELVFLETGEQLNTSIIAALRLASKWMLQAYNHEALNLDLVNSKSYVEVAFAAFVDGLVLRNKNVFFDEDYVRDAAELMAGEDSNCSPELYSRLTMTESEGKRGYRKSYLPPLRRGFSAFLVALHIRRAVVLPFNFKWPMGVEKDRKTRRVIRRRELVCLADLPELLRLFRALESQAETQTEKVFSQYSRRQRERLAFEGQRLIVATGWLTPDDANYDDLLALYVANEKIRFASSPHLACLMMADLLERKYQTHSPINGSGWQTHLSRSRVLQGPRFDRAPLNQINDEAAILEQAIGIRASQMTPESVRLLSRLPGLDADLTEKSKTWLEVENAYLKKVKREDNKGRLTAIGHLNAYLFAYLPYWFAAHPAFSYALPDYPNKLLGSVFVSDLGLLDDRERPVTLVEFMAAVAANRKWANSSHYANLKQIEIFFSFIERFQDQLPGCAGFQQPLSTHDYPPTARSFGTNKRPIPRRIFKFYLEYIEAVTTHAEVLLNRILSGVVSDTQTGALIPARARYLDCFQLQDLFGFIPVVFYRGKVIPLRYVPNVLFLGKKRLKDGRVLRIPHPHAMHQIIVSLYTGLRQHHIQWLDAETFDCHVGHESGKLDYAELHVNTDKERTAAWQPHVNFRVIEILRAQLAWRHLIGEEGFSNKVFYNNNPDSKWGQFYPLFAYSANGDPHSDAVYSSAWHALLHGVQAMQAEIGEPPTWLVRLLPSSVPYADPDQAQRLCEYGSQQKRICRLFLKTDITPHSARVSVVSHAISILPADLIGRYWTGQTEATVYHYVVPDEDEIDAEQQRQNLMLRQRGYEQGYDAMLAAFPGRKGPFIKADDINSRLSKSLQTNVEETISVYGCVSLSLNGNTKTGLDVLRETRAVGVVATKTELCPYGSQCPPEVVVALNGFRRCGPCHFAVRSIDHLPAITAKIRQVLEGLTEIEARLDANDAESLTTDEWDALAKNRDVLAEDLAAWQMAAEVLEVMRQRVAAGDSTKTWHVQRPEIIEQGLKRAQFPTEMTDYLLARLHESEAFPLLESPQIRAKFDLLRRNLLANTGNIREALRLEQPTNPAAECLGLIRAIAAANQLGIEDIRRMMETGDISAISARTLRMLPMEES